MVPCFSGRLESPTVPTARVGFSRYRECSNPIQTSLHPWYVGAGSLSGSKETAQQSRHWLPTCSWLPPRLRTFSSRLSGGVLCLTGGHHQEVRSRGAPVVSSLRHEHVGDYSTTGSFPHYPTSISLPTTGRKGAVRKKGSAGAPPERP